VAVEISLVAFGVQLTFPVFLSRQHTLPFLS